MNSIDNSGGIPADKKQTRSAEHINDTGFLRVCQPYLENAGFKRGLGARLNGFGVIQNVLGTP